MNIVHDSSSHILATVDCWQSELEQYKMSHFSILISLSAPF